MFGECHAHLFMNGYDYRKAVALHKGHVAEDEIRGYLSEYQRRGITFIREGGDDLGVSSLVKRIAGEYGIDYRSPVFAIHKNHHYGGIVGKGFDTMEEYRELVMEAIRRGADFIKIMLSGLVDFDQYGVITSSPLTYEEMREMVAIAHQEGLSVMAHVNGAEPVRLAAMAGVDSIEHGRYLGEESLQAMKEHHTLWVPTLATVKNLIGCDRYPKEVVEQIYQSDRDHVKQAKRMGVQMALGSDAGAYLVPHGKGIEDEYRAFQEILGAGSELDAYLQSGEEAIRERFQRGGVLQ